MTASKIPVNMCQKFKSWAFFQNFREEKFSQGLDFANQGKIRENREINPRLSSLNHFYNDLSVVVFGFGLVVEIKTF